MFSKVPRRFVESSMSGPMYGARRDDAEVDPRLLDRLDVGRVGQQRRVVDDDLPAAVLER